jgi:thiol-disulfide isomerase/thioredoxin
VGPTNAPNDSEARRRLLFRASLVGSAALILALVGLILGLVSLHHARDTAEGSSSPPTQVLGVGAEAPGDFTLARLGGGQPLVLSRLLDGHPAVINVFASWCTACAAELDAFGAVSQSFARRVVFVGIDSNETSPRRAESLLATAHATYPVGLDTSLAVATSYGVVELPTTFFLAADGRITAVVVGAESRAALTAHVTAALAASGSPS